MGVLEGRTTVLLAAAGAPWEAGAVSSLTEAGLVIGKRCVDVTDLLATASTGIADVVVVAADLPGLDADVVRRVTDHVGGVVAVAHPDSVERVRRLGISEVLVDPTPSELATRVVAWTRRPDLAPGREDASEIIHAPAGDGRVDDASGQGRVVVVWGPTGAPGRTTVATAVAAERAAGGGRVVLVDADPYGGAIGQNLGIIDDVSGLLAAARAVNEGTMTPESLARCRRTHSPGLEVLTGLPRPDRWTEVRPGSLAHVIETSALHADVVVDVGFGLADDRHQGRDRITLEALDLADTIVVVGGAEPVGLARLARGLVELGERGLAPDVVVINRMRDSLGWTRKDLTGMVAGYVWEAEVRFVRDDRETVDKALASGRSLVELGASRVRGDLAEVTGTAFGS